MYRAKEKDKNNFHYYTEDINRRTFELLLLENDLRRALDQNQFFVAFQPQFSLNGGMLVGVEALMRWQHPAQGLIAPSEFIPLAEETGLIVPLGRWMLRASCTQIRQWLDRGYRLGRIAVNLSARQFRQPGLVEDITLILNEVGLSPEHLELEITESIAMDNVETTIAKLEVLKNMGLQLSIDDFGTGYSSLSYLKRFAIDKLKIDKSFVRDIVTDPNDAAIAASTIALAHKMGLKVIAEGVETAEQVAFLREQGCDEVQGFFYGKPVPAREFERLLNMTPRRHRA
jgi:EAL domain-containing protein (putative c-di-GMP-specific phosphodiesterase class I)